MLRYSVVLLPNPGEAMYTVVVPELPGLTTQGANVEDALANVREAIEVHLEGLALDGEQIPEEIEPVIFARVEVQPDLTCIGVLRAERQL